MEPVKIPHNNNNNKKICEWKQQCKELSRILSKVIVEQGKRNT